MALRRSFSSEQCWEMSSFSAAAKFTHATFATYESSIAFGMSDHLLHGSEALLQLRAVL